ncbi:hypothetical protein GGI20_001361 [Coemansia sp. BCRC 34301]|nr:hypothetical protein GGI20_001361 [Coemansia sp. BCRC 34301]
MATESELAGTGDSWETGLAQQILQSCGRLLGELESIRLGVQDGTARDACSAEWAATKARMAAMEQAKTSGHLASASRQVVGALRTCVQALAGSAALDAADAPSLRATTMALHEAAAGLRQAHSGLRIMRGTDPDPTGVVGGPDPTSVAEDPDPSGVVFDALRAAAALAGLLRIFTRVSQQSWAATRLQLAHTPPVPSPLAVGSALRHRRWVSEEIDADLPPAPGVVIGADAQALGARRLPELSAHSRNRSDSRLPRKSALSLRRPSPPIGGLADLPERAKQVRFLPAASSDSPIDQAHLTELVQLLSLFERAIATLQAATNHSFKDTTNRAAVVRDSYAQAIRGLAAAFLQLSRLSSATGLVRHYDKPTLAQFKATTHAVKLLMPLVPRQIQPR